MIVISHSSHSHSLFLVDGEQDQSCIGRAHQMTLSLCVSLFVLYWHVIAFMGVLAAAVEDRRLPPERVLGKKKGKKNLFLSKTTQQGHIMACDRNSQQRC